MSKKINPRRRPVTEADIKRAQDRATDEAMKRVLYMVLYVLVDKHGATHEELAQLGSEVNYVADSIRQGYVSWADIRQALKADDIELDLR